MGAAPQEFVELIRTPFQGEDIVAAFGQPGMQEGLHEVFRPYVAPDFVTEMVADSSFRAERVGLEGFMEAWRDWAEPFDSLRVEVTEMREHGDRLLTLVDQIGVPKGGSNEIRAKAAAVWQFAGGKLVRVEFHLSPEVAEASARGGG